MWYLVLIIFIGNMNSSPAVREIQFDNRESCESARKDIMLLERAPKEFRLICVRK